MNVPSNAIKLLWNWISRLVSRIRSFSIATVGIPEDRSSSLVRSLSLFSIPSFVLQGDASVVRKRRATEDDRGFRRDKWRVSGGYFDSGTIALGNDRVSFLSFPLWSFFLFLHLRHGWLLISWFKMSDTRTIDRACAF